MDPDRPKRNDKKKRQNRIWPIEAFFITFLAALILSFFSETTLLGVSMPVALLVLAAIILIGIGFDVIGIAVTLEDITAYTAMASKRIRGAREAIKLVQNAHLVSNICNDVVGDICGIVSGAMGAAISIRLLTGSPDLDEIWINAMVSSLIAGITVSGKACGKVVSARYSHHIVFMVGCIMAFFSPKDKR